MSAIEKSSAVKEIIHSMKRQNQNIHSKKQGLLEYVLQENTISVFIL